MATNKTYIIMKDGEELKTLKTLTAAKKLADAEGTEVFCEGECVYQGAKDPEDVLSEVEEQDGTKAGVYILLTLMNIRKGPSLDAEKLGTAKAGTVVDVCWIRDDWMYLSDGTYILYGNGKYAEKV